MAAPNFQHLARIPPGPEHDAIQVVMKDLATLQTTVTTLQTTVAVLQAAVTALTARVAALEAAP